MVRQAFRSQSFKMPILPGIGTLHYQLKRRHSNYIIVPYYESCQYDTRVEHVLNARTDVLVPMLYLALSKVIRNMGENSLAGQASASDFGKNRVVLC